MVTVKVDMDMCQNYGQCVFEAPQIFRLDADDKLEYTAESDEENRGDIEAAVDVCPMQAIRILS
ncbi:ferredoxin [Glaciihabitans arcticus]|uniref:Ferredoxin n=1 Tax=Glaciihabitans arcticus TaxID=2668039 RepID=A0A4Q9GRL2_9MICO|nr:ferredoxin [Glaciihabitans arcticus]TBN56724.1 ferredoxin [Glaciihabitans arcticus]